MLDFIRVPSPAARTITAAGEVIGVSSAPGRLQPSKDTRCHRHGSRRRERLAPPPGLDPGLPASKAVGLPLPHGGLTVAIMSRARIRGRPGPCR